MALRVLSHVQPRETYGKPYGHFHDISEDPQKCITISFEVKSSSDPMWSCLSFMNYILAGSCQACGNATWATATRHYFHLFDKNDSTWRHTAQTRSCLTVKAKTSKNNDWSSELNRWLTRKTCFCIPKVIANYNPNKEPFVKLPILI